MNIMIVINFREGIRMILDFVKRQYRVLLIALFPIFLLLINRNWIFFENPYGNNVDSWVYTGYFFNYENYYKIFGQLYYGDRVSWIFPGYFFNHILSPLVANYILHIVFFCLALLALYFIIKMIFDENTAFLISLMMGTYTFFIREIGSNYGQGSVITYFLLIILFLTASAKSTHWKIFLFLGGICFASMIYAHMFTIIFTPYIIVYYIIANHQWRKNSNPVSLLYFIIGIVTISIIYSGINIALTGNWCFFSAQLNSVFYYYVHTPTEPKPILSYLFKIYSSFFTFDSLILPELIFVTSCLSLVCWNKYKKGDKNHFSLFFPLSYILMFGFFFYIDIKGNYSLLTQFYNCYLIPFIFLAIAPQISLILKEIHGNRLDLVLIFSLFLFGLPLIVYNFAIFQYPLVKFIAIGIFILILFQNMFTFKYISRLKSPKIKDAIFSIVIILLCITYTIFNCCLYTSNAYTNIDFHGIDTQENGYMAITDSIGIINHEISTNKVRFWYNINETNENGYYGGLYGSINSVYLWMYTYIGQDFPNIDQSKFETPFYWPQPPPEVVILSTDPVVFEKAQRSLNAIGYNATFISEKPVHRGNISFNITIINIAKV